MKLSDFKYKVNDKLIAQYPVKPRDAARLMILNRKEKTISEGKFRDIVQFFEEDKYWQNYQYFLVVTTVTYPDNK